MAAIIIDQKDAPHPRIAELGQDWIRVGDVTADDTEHEIAAEPGAVLIAEGVGHVMSGGKPLQLHRWWTLRVTGNVKHDAVSLSVTETIGNSFWNGRVSVCGVVIEAVSDKPPAGAR
jgi:hypothetical protein